MAVTNPLQSSKCPWKGTAAYYDATINDNIVKDIAWWAPPVTGPSCIHERTRAAGTTPSRRKRPVPSRAMSHSTRCTPSATSPAAVAHQIPVQNKVDTEA
ncbi:hypothetical protein OBBRIDRAFT_797860 [Obba rivulosa]|uniref:DUF427 domain-containing protein n=1 Tax=Obba rivulosa TaxID=1052685 RepID=A0A8E2DFA1_9APHY|nr:hypothetical protein OBBRIDRAFT_797860 [Obba rivulosa]